jgi:uncharacterized protein (TIGR02145 family)
MDLVFLGEIIRMRSLLLIFCLLFVGVCNSQTTGTMTDSRDGKVYKTVVIGTQTWMAENLNVATFRNGDPIPEEQYDVKWIRAREFAKPAWCYYNKDTTKGRIYGKLYSWAAVSDPRGLAPEGWHIPTDEDWTILSDYLGGDEVAGKKMKSNNGWLENGNGTNTCGFLGLPGGGRFGNGEFNNFGYYGWWWSSSENYLTLQWKDDSLDFNRNLRSGQWLMIYGLSVRCVKD